MAATVRLDRALAVLALGLLAGGLAVAVAPGGTLPLPSSLRSLDQQGAQTTVEILVALVIGLYVCWRLVRGPVSGMEEPVPAEYDDAAPESDRGDGDAGAAPRGGPDPFGSSRDRRTGAGRATVDARIAGAEIDGDIESRRTLLRSASGAPAPEPVDDLRNTAVALEHSRGLDLDAARERVERGDWTDDPVAAAFVGGPEAGRISLPRRLLAICYPARAFDRRLERTIDALERAAERTGSDVPSTAGGTIDARAGEDRSNDATPTGAESTDAASNDATPTGAESDGAESDGGQSTDAGRTSGV